MDPAGLTERQRGIWSLGDYSYISRLLRPAAAALCDACAVGAGQEVLDVAAGDGNFALACARQGARVVASDISPAMVERGRARSEAEGYAIEWMEADAEELPFEDERFDCVGSVFGTILAPRPSVAARELFRVARPGGTVGMTAWTPESFAAAQFALRRRYTPSQPGQPLAEEWGVEETVRERFDGLADRVELEKRTLAVEADTPEGLVARLGKSGGSWEAARRALPPEPFDAMVAEFTELVRRRGGEGPVRIDNEYAVIVAPRRGRP